MKLLLERGARPYLAGVIAGVLLIAGCSGSRSLPSAVPGSGLAPSSHVTIALTITGGAPEGVVPDACTNPTKLKVCLKPGGKVLLGIKLTCHSGSSSVPCGKVHW
ncbi:MAG TPA: hypothetical protein VKS80_06575, partial [Trinickia sp.]|nr:hypothetical protein [Trinickia sp.]